MSRDLENWVDKIDFDMLHHQKYALIYLLEAGKDKNSELWGLVHMIDDLQDLVEARGYWSFPEDATTDDTD